MRQSIHSLSLTLLAHLGNFLEQEERPASSERQEVRGAALSCLVESHWKHKTHVCLQHIVGFSIPPFCAYQDCHSQSTSFEMKPAVWSFGSWILKTKHDFFPRFRIYMMDEIDMTDLDDLIGDLTTNVEVDLPAAEDDVEFLNFLLSLGDVGVQEGEYSRLPHLASVLHMKNRISSCSMQMSIQQPYTMIQRHVQTPYSMCLCTVILRDS